MAENIAETTSNLKREIKRSASYPGFTVMESYDFASKINANFSNSEVTRDEIGHAFNLHPNTISRDIAACVQFGFLDKNQARGTYQLTKLFSDIFRPENEKEWRIGLITAFGLPKLYQELIQKFDNHVIPLELANTLIKHHAITEAASQIAADTFIRSGMDVGVITENRILKFSVTLSTLAKTQYAEIIEETVKSGNENRLPVKVDNYSLETNSDKHIEIPIYLTGGKEASFKYPSNITEGDIRIVEHQLQGILLKIQIEKDERKKGEEPPLK